jgi:hypothetical protein
VRKALPLAAFGPAGWCSRPGCDYRGRYRFDDDPGAYCSEACYLAARRSAAEAAAYQRGFQAGVERGEALARVAAWLSSYPAPERAVAWLGLVGELEAEAAR